MANCRLIAVWGLVPSLILGCGSGNGASEPIEIQMLRINAGSFVMGSLPGESGREANEIAHTVHLTRDFDMGVWEITQEQYENVVGENPAYFHNCGPDCPIEQVSTDHAMDFCNALSDREGLERCYADFGADPRWENLDCKGYRLPTEAEWEYAARAGSQTAFANGDLKATGCEIDPALDAIGWYCANSENRPHPVGTKASNAWGLHDMHGNVWEWVADGYAPYPDEEAIDPIGPLDGKNPLMRGGAWGYSARYARSAYRMYAHPGHRDILIGFRVARTAD